MPTTTGNSYKNTGEKTSTPIKVNKRKEAKQGPKQQQYNRKNLH
jgi:hypothetical protein